MKKTIMIVDKEPDIRKIIKIILEKKGYKVITATNGNDCLDKLKKHKTNLILLDIIMTGTPLKKIIPKIKKTKIIFMSGIGISKKEEKELLKPKNILDFIYKPFDIKKLIRKVKKATA